MAKNSKIRARASAKKNRIKKQKQKSHNNDLIKAIRKWDDPILKQVSSPVDQNDDTSFIRIMKETLLATKDGIGLSAPQIGISKRVIVFRSDSESKDLTTMINPVIVEENKIRATIQEGCLSYPGVFAKVERPTKVKVKWKDIYGRNKSKEFQGIESVVVQHEIDHLEGVCLVGEYWLKQN